MKSNFLSNNLNHNASSCDWENQLKQEIISHRIKNKKYRSNFYPNLVSDTEKQHAVETLTENDS